MEGYRSIIRIYRLRVNQVPGEEFFHTSKVGRYFAVRPQN